MSATFCIFLKASQRLFINGAVLRVDRKVSIELLNDAVFLLESHVMQPEAATTPLRKLYFIVQTILMDPACEEEASKIFWQNYAFVFNAAGADVLREDLMLVSRQFDARRYVEVLKKLRTMFHAEAPPLELTNIIYAPHSPEDGDSLLKNKEVVRA